MLRLAGGDASPPKSATAYISQRSDSLANKINEPWPKNFYPKKLNLLIKLLPNEAIARNQIFTD